MMTLLVLRSRLRSLYQKYELYINPIVKFVIALIVFQTINSALGYDSRLKQLPVVLAISLLSAFTPSSILVLLAGLFSVGHIYSISIILAAIIVILFAIMYCLFLRFTPNLGYAVLAVPILFFLKIPYVIPILLGLFATPLSVIPIGCGVVVYYLFEVLKEATAMQVTVSLEDTLQLYTYVIDSLFKSQQLYMTIIIFSLVTIVTFIVRRMKFDYAREGAVAAGSLTCIIGFLISDLRLDVSNQIGAMILGTLVSGIFAIIIQFFRLALDYTGVEHVQFEDEDYYYYVKAVPKINVTAPQINVKRFNTQRNAGLSGRINKEMLEDEEDDYDDEYEGYDEADTNSKGSSVK
ncbi:hypothetical protein acsn021_38550 [Anaerocolumna cellulosilytica]|uniref:Uncharacterized protein n=1 Tax=Anaerocolumna cellulosilytica TaxID=433286 RepID=A0A6S6R2C5_9FIRM|nr:hypothetical protein [Anaerocolumna cellulosilytica]MBB5196257.1 hypothetical protein [Anaerocolumna cellulosilytica]BCJ96286.1 hypothetical protein acsn021_38550 [Anaerocolumna cellulosilytica]